MDFSKQKKKITFIGIGLVSGFLFLYGIWQKVDLLNSKKEESDKKSDSKIQDQDKKGTSAIDQNSQNKENKNPSMFISCGGFIE